MRIKTLKLPGLLVVLALLLAACGAQPTQAFPGLTADEELVFLAQGNQLRVVDLATGQQKWAFPNPAAAGVTGSFASQPAVEGDLVVAGSEGPANAHSGSVFGIDRNTGAQKWCLVFDEKSFKRLAPFGCRQAQVTKETGLFGFSVAVDNRILGGIALVDGQAFFGLSSGAVYAVDAATGRDLWHFNAERDIWSTPVVTEDTVYVTSLDHHVYALNRATGAQRWKADMGATVAGTPTLYEDTLYVGTFGNILAALDADTGEQIWTFATTNWVWDGPAVLDNTLYFADVGGTVYAIDADERTPVWPPRKPGGAMRARPTVTEDWLFVGDRSGNLFALERGSGAVAWTKTLKGEILVTPAVVNDLVVVATFSGANLLEAYTTNGDFKWPFAPTN